MVKYGMISEYPASGFNNLYPYTDFHEMNLDWCLKIIKANKDNITELYRIFNEWADSADRIKELYQAIISGNYPKELEDSLIKWVQENAVDIVGDMVNMVFFGLTDDGYFVAYIPSGWGDITFGTTGYDDFPAGVDYGHLTLTY